MKLPSYIRFGRPIPAWGVIAAAAIAAAATVGTAVYSANQQKKAQAKAQQAAEINKLPEYKLRPAPEFMPTNFGSINKTAIQADNDAFARSDADFRARHGKTVKAEKLFEDSVLQDQQGESELMPAIQGEFMRAGLSGALGAFGNTPGTLAPNSAGEASVARNLGLSVLGFQDRNRANRQTSLRMAEDIFQRRAIGLSGGDAAAIEVANNSNQNAFNQQIYANQVAADNKNYDIGAENRNAATATANANAQAQAQQGAALVGAVGSAVSNGAQAYAYNRGQQSVTPRPNNVTQMPALSVSGTQPWQKSAAGLARAA